MHTLRLGQRLMVAVGLSLTLLIVGAVGLGMGIQHGAIQPPHFDVSFAGLHIVAYTTDPIECQPYLPCHGSSRDYYVVWVYNQTVPKHKPEKGFRILSVPLQHRFSFTSVDHP